MTRFLIPLAKFNFVLPAMAELDHVRVSLRGIHIQASKAGTILIGTDGSVMLAAHCPDMIAKKQSFSILPDTNMRRACRMKNRKTALDDRILEIDPVAETWCLLTKAGEVDNEGGRLPVETEHHQNLTHLFRDEIVFDTTIPPVSTNTLEAIVCAGKVIRNSVSFSGSGITPGHPVVVSFSESDYLGLIMPISQHPSYPAAPADLTDWFKNAAKQR